MKRIILLLAIPFAIFASCTNKSSIPKYDHVIVVIEENHGYDEVIGSSNAPYINQLANDGVLFTNSNAITHPSQPNYLILYSGNSQQVNGDDCLEKIEPYTTPNLGAALMSKGLDFKGYAQTMPSQGYLKCIYGKSTINGLDLYVRKHCPWVNWQGTGTNQIPATASVPMTDFPKDYSKLPTVSFVIPDMDYDMHNISPSGDADAIKSGDQWLKDNLAGYAEWAKTHNSLLIVTFDEDDYNPKNVNHIPTIFYGDHVSKGNSAKPITHYSVLHTLEAMYQLPVTDDSKAEAITDVWK